MYVLLLSRVVTWDVFCGERRKRTNPWELERHRNSSASGKVSFDGFGGAAADEDFEKDEKVYQIKFYESFIVLITEELPLR